MKKDLLKFCRYYKGESSNPYEGDKAMFWGYEQIWIRLSEQGAFEDSDMLEDYNMFGLKEFCKDDGIPITLKALLFNRFRHWKDGYGLEIDRDRFKSFYDEYKQN